MVDFFLNEKTEYAFRVLLYLMPYGKVAPMTEAAGYMQVPREQLRTIGSKLKAGGIVKYVSGSYGGYVLNEDPCKITLFDVINCMERSKKAPELKECNVISSVLAEAQSEYIDFLKSTTINDLYEKVKA